MSEKMDAYTIYASTEYVDKQIENSKTEDSKATVDELKAHLGI